MIYTDLTIKAMNIAYKAHLNQMDKSGSPYIFHPIHLAEQCDDEISCATALLHDVVEDCEGYSFKLLEQEGIPSSVIDALKLLTHAKGTPYLEYIEDIKTNPIAVKVKLLDLNHNLDEDRLKFIQDEEIKDRLTKKRAIYKKALELLNS